MARKIRIEYAGAAYHVMARGNQGRHIYADDRDRKLWLETLGEACAKTGWHIHAWVMMNNHYHLLLETPEANLVAGMKWLQGTYTQRYNSRHEIFGHLFQGRYKAVVVEPEAGNYFAVVSTYIHLNPARAGLIRVGQERLVRYRWSSYPWYVTAGEARPSHTRGNCSTGSEPNAPAPLGSTRPALGSGECTCSRPQSNCPPPAPLPLPCSGLGTDGRKSHAANYSAGCKCPAAISSPPPGWLRGSPTTGGNGCSSSPRHGCANRSSHTLHPASPATACGRGHRHRYAAPGCRAP